MSKLRVVLAPAICCLLSSAVTLSAQQKSSTTPNQASTSTPKPTPKVVSNKIVKVECKSKTPNGKARTLSVGAFPIRNGLEVKYFDASFGARRLMEDRWFYRSCVRSGEKIDCNTSCVDYEVYNESKNETVKLKDQLPGFDNYLSVPAFKWPYVAYLAVSRGKEGSSQINYEFRVVDWGQKQRMACVYLFSQPAPTPGQLSSAPFIKFEWPGKSAVIAWYKDAEGHARTKQLPLP